jgi:site-specific recombinase XerD
MTPKALLTEEFSLSSINNTSIHSPSNVDYSNLLNLETYLDAISQKDHPSPTNDVTFSKLYHSERRRGLERILNHLSKKELSGKRYLDEYLRDQYRRNLRVNTLRNSCREIVSFLEFVKDRGRDHIEKIMREDLEAWIEHEQDRGIKTCTVDMRLRLLKAFLRFLIDREILRAEVLSKRLSVKVPDALPRAMDPDDVNRLLSVIHDVRDRAMVTVLLRTGMRIGELLSTLVSEVHLKDKKIEIYEAEKTRVGRVVYLSEDAIASLKAWLRKRNKDYAYLIYGRKGKPLTYQAARNRFGICLGKAGLSHKGYSLHCLRHTFATELLNAGMRIECLQQLLGHSSLEMTRRYARLTDRTRETEYFKAMAIIEKGETDVHH